MGGGSEIWNLEVPVTLVRFPCSPEFCVHHGLEAQWFLFPHEVPWSEHTDAAVAER